MCIVLIAVSRYFVNNFIQNHPNWLYVTKMVEISQEPLQTLTPSILKYAYVRRTTLQVRLSYSHVPHARAFDYPFHVTWPFDYIMLVWTSISTRETYPMLLFAVISYFYFHCSLYTTSASVSSNLYYLCLNRQICNMNRRDHKLSYRVLNRYNLFSI